MPLASRREEIDRFISGAAEVCASTDVIGHGVNLPCETLLFAETEKFDGKERRDLEPWEIAQIAGRAGRFGFHERGHVGVLTGVPWAHPDPALVRDALTPHVELPGGHLGYRVVDTGRIRPQLADLNVTRVDEIEPALHAWRNAALRFWAVEGWLQVESIQPLLAARRRAIPPPRPRKLELADVWRLMQAPIDEDGLPLSARSPPPSPPTTHSAPSSPGSSSRTGCARRRSGRPRRPRGRRRSSAGSHSSTRAWRA